MSSPMPSPCPASPPCPAEADAGWLADAEAADIAELEALEAEEAASRRDHPLAWATLWHSPRTSQRVAAQTVTRAGILYGYLLGGNRSGKTEFAAQLSVAVAQGRDHPDTVAWCQQNGLDLSRVGTGPGVVVVGSPDSNDSRRFVRPKVAGYLPAGSKWRNRDGTGEAEVDLPGGGKIVFKSVDQGRDGWQGFAARLVVFDEEPRDMGVVSEALMRVADFAGWIVFSMTPLYGWSALLRAHVQTPGPDAAVAYLTGTDNPHMDPEFLRRLYARYGAHERDARERGAIVALEGRVYTDWRRDVHVVSGWPAGTGEGARPPRGWPIYVGIDWGTRNPTAILWVAHDLEADVLHVYRVLYEAGRTRAWLARRYLTLAGYHEDPTCEGEWMAGEDTEQAEWIVADPEDRGARLTWAQEFGIVTLRADKRPGSVRGGISAVAERLALDVEGHPGLVVHECCAPLIREVESYVWDTTASKGDLPDRPLKRDDHALDGLRYLVAKVARSGALEAAEDEEAAA